MEYSGRKNAMKTKTAKLKNKLGKSKKLTKQQLYIQKLENALERISDPIYWMRLDAEQQGYKLDGHAAFSLSNDPAYLRDIAKRALDT